MSIIIEFIFFLLRILELLIIAECLMSWFPGARMSKAYEFVGIFTQPILSPIRNLLFRYVDIPIDFSPIVAFFLISMLKRLILSIMF